MKITFEGVKPVKQKDGTWVLVDYVREEEFLETANRHTELCIVCGFPSYPECREWCESERFKPKKS